MTRAQWVKHREREWGFRITWREIAFKNGVKDFSIDILQPRGGDPRNPERTTVGVGPTWEAAAAMADQHMKEELARIQALA